MQKLLREIFGEAFENWKVHVVVWAVYFLMFALITLTFMLSGR